MVPEWTDAERDVLRIDYPQIGKAATAKILGRPEAQVRSMASKLGIKQDRNSAFHSDWQRRAAQTKIGRKRPAQAHVMRRNRALGKLTMTPDARVVLSVRTKERWRLRGHPRGMLGVRHSPETLARLSDLAKARWKNMTEEQRSVKTMRMLKTKEAKGSLYMQHTKTTWKASWQEIGGVRKYYRSRWEANYARYLDLLKTRGEIAGWSHEPETFWFEKIRRGTRSYLPDFRVLHLDGAVEYHEVKGWMDDKSRVKLKRMAKYHPKIKLKLIDGDAYKKIQKEFGPLIVGWDGLPKMLERVRLQNFPSVEAANAPVLLAA